MDIPKTFITAIARLRTKAKKAVTHKDFVRVSEAAYRAYEKGRAAVPGKWPDNKPTLDAMAEEVTKIRQLAQASIAAAEEAHAKARDEEIGRLKREHREQQRRDWRNQ